MPKTQRNRRDVPAELAANVCAPMQHTDVADSWPASREKAFAGREPRQRPLLQAPEGWSLVGLECLEPDQRLHGGSILFAVNDRIAGHGRGYITSVTWSIELEKFIALGLYQGGLAQAGEEIVC